MEASELLQRVKSNLIITFEDDDSLIVSYIAAAISYAEGFQHVGSGFYLSHEMGETTKQGVVMLASHFYESRDGGTAGFFARSAAASDQAMRTIDSLLRLDREWKV